MKEIQTPSPRDQASEFRRTKFTSNLNSDPRKAVNKSSNPALKSVLKDDSTALEIMNEVPDVSVNSPLSAENLAAAYPVDTLPLNTVAISDLTLSSMSSEITSDKHVLTNDGDTKHGNSDYKLESYEAEVVIKHLREARIQVMKSKDLGHSKKLLDAMIKIAIEEFYGGRCEDATWIDKLTSSKANLVSLIVVMGIFAVLVFWIFNSGTKGFVTGPTPS